MPLCGDNIPGRRIGVAGMSFAPAVALTLALRATLYGTPLDDNNPGFYPGDRRMTDVYEPVSI